MKFKDFLKSLGELRSSLLARIEADCDGFDIDPKAQSERLKKVMADDGYEYFVNTYFPHYIRSTSKSEMHHYIFDKLPKVLTTKSSVSLAAAAPRGEAKSTLVTQLFVLWCILTGRKKYVCIVMDSIDQAYPMLESIKTELEANPRLAQDFPKIAGAGSVWNMGTIVTRNLIKVQVFGSGKKMRGLRHGAYRPDLVVLDDIENDEQVRSPEQRDKLNDWVNKTILNLGAAGEKFDVIYIGTILHYDSVLNRTLKNPLWESVRFKAIKQFPDNMVLWEKWEEILRNSGQSDALLFYQRNKRMMDKGTVVSWEARPIYTLMEIRVKVGYSAFDSEYQNDPVSGDDAPFANCISFWVNRLTDWIFFGACDPSLGKHGASRDPSALLVGGFNRGTGVLDVVEANIKKRIPDKIISDVIELQRQYRCVLWVIESVQFQEFMRTELIKRSAALGIPVPARAVIPNTDKLLRIESIQPHMANGLIRLHPSQTTLIEQLRHFPKAAHDDGADALQMLWMAASTGFAQIEYTPISKKSSRGAW